MAKQSSTLALLERQDKKSAGPQQTRKFSFDSIMPQIEGMCAGCSGGDCQSCKGSRTSANFDLLSVDFSLLGEIAGIEKQQREAQPVVQKDSSSDFGFGNYARSDYEEEMRKWLMQIGIEKYLKTKEMLEEKVLEKLFTQSFAESISDDGFFDIHSAMKIGRRKRERAKLKESGNKTSDEKRRLEALEQEILKKQMELEGLKIKNLENALSALECSFLYSPFLRVAR